MKGCLGSIISLGGDIPACAPCEFRVACADVAYQLLERFREERGVSPVSKIVRKDFSEHEQARQIAQAVAGKGVTAAMIRACHAAGGNPFAAYGNEGLKLAFDALLADGKIAPRAIAATIAAQSTLTTEQALSVEKVAVLSFLAMGIVQYSHAEKAFEYKP